MSDAKGETSRERLMTMKQFSDGFKIADTDLKLRGPGDFFGSRQHGLPELKIADMVEDMDTLKKAQECAQDILKSDFSLSSEGSGGRGARGLPGVQQCGRGGGIGKRSAGVADAAGGDGRKGFKGADAGG